MCSETEHFYNVTGTTIAGADIDAIRNLNSYAKTLMQPDGTLTNPGNLNVAGKTTSKGIQSNGVVSDWITGSFGGSPYRGDRVVLGTIHHTAVVGSHNNELNAWTPIQLQGSTVNIASQNPVRIPKDAWANGGLQVDGNQRIEGNISMGDNSTFSVDAPGVVGGRFNIDKDGNTNIKGNLKTKHFFMDSVGWNQTKSYNRTNIPTGLMLPGPGIYILSAANQVMAGWYCIAWFLITSNNEAKVLGWIQINNCYLGVENLQVTIKVPGGDAADIPWTVGAIKVG